jgi:hypothetical protein
LWLKSKPFLKSAELTDLIFSNPFKGNSNQAIL